MQPEEQQVREWVWVCVVGGCWRLCEVFEVGVGWWLEVVAGGCCVRETEVVGDGCVCASAPDRAMQWAFRCMCIDQTEEENANQ